MASKAPVMDEISALFAVGEPDEMWMQVEGVIRLIDPAFDFARSRATFSDVMALFRGEFPGYAPVRTLYHDQAHTLEVFLCAVRLLHGIHVGAMRMQARDIELVMLAVLMHDIGYAQLRGEETGTGAQYTQSHVTRGIEFMRHYVADKGLPTDFAEALDGMIRGTDPGYPFGNILFPDPRTHLLGQIVATADLVGQMADRAYLEKLLFLYLEFKEANFGNYQSVTDMLRQTRKFYSVTKEKLDTQYGGLYRHFSDHFRVTMGVTNNFYLESIEKNIFYLDQIAQIENVEYLVMLKRGGIVDRAKSEPGFRV